MPTNFISSYRSARIRCARRCARLPRGFTLIEMLLVLALLSVVALLVTPSLVGLHRRQQFKQAAMVVLGRLAAARVNAAEQGVTYEFWYEPGGHRYLVLPGPTTAAESSPSGAAGQRLPASADALPANAMFAAEPAGRKTAVPIDPVRLCRLTDAAGLDRAEWTGPISFYPDGTATRAAFRVTDTRGDTMYFSVNRLTGTAKATTAP